MRILVLTTDAFGGHGGIAKYNRDLIKALCKHPDCLEVVVLPRFTTGEWDGLPEGVTYLTESAGSKLRYIYKVFSVLLKDRDFDLVICGHINLISVAFLAKKITGARLVLFIYGIDVWRRVGGNIVEYMLRQVNKFVSISEVTKQRFLDWAPVSSENIGLLPNAIDIDAYRPGEKSESLCKRYGLGNKIVLMTLGRISADERYKGFDEIIDIIPRLNLEVPNIIYLVCGDGTDRNRLENKVEKLGLQEQVIFTGHVPEREKIDHFRLADVYVMPSQGEGFGFVFLEALACGIPVIASKVDGGREAVRNGDLGIVVDPDNPDELKSSIIQSLQKCKGVVLEGLNYFSFDNFTQRCHRIINQVVCD